MASQPFTYKKISELPSANTINDSDVLIVNHNGKTSKITFEDLMSVINAKVVHDLSGIESRLTNVENATSRLATTVSDNTGTINNIITAGFNLIGIESEE